MAFVKIFWYLKKTSAYCTLNLVVSILSSLTLYMLLYLPSLGNFHNNLNQNAINIGTAACSKSGAFHNATYMETVTLVKSILVSAKVFKVKRQINIYLFVDTTMEAALKTEFVALQNSVRNEINVSIHVQRIQNADELGKSSLFPKFEIPCSFVRLLFPNLLTLDTILYLDIDTIVSGNIENIWDNLRAENHALAALAPDTIPGDAYESLYLFLFGSFKHVPPRGANSGVLFMHLENMRQFKWTEKAIDKYRQESQVLSDDQRLINALFNENLDKLRILPCNYNFIHVHCDKGWSCVGRYWEPGGIKILHGAGSRFHIPTSSHYQMFNAYKQISVNSSREQLIRELLMLKEIYSVKHESTCGGQMGQQLFNNLPDANKL